MPKRIMQKDGRQYDVVKGDDYQTVIPKTWKNADHYIADPANDGMFPADIVNAAKKRIKHEMIRET